MDGIVLDSEQLNLLSFLVELARSTPLAERQPIRLLGADGFHYLVVVHPRAPNPPPQFYPADVDTLAENGLIRVSRVGYHDRSIDVLPLGYRFYDWQKQQSANSVQRIETEVRSYIETLDFERLYPTAFTRWREAETLLWKADNDSELSTIGHKCREALQAFTTELLAHLKLQVTTDPTKTVARLREVAASRSHSKAKTALLSALLELWGTVSDLVQRQEHAGTKEGVAVSWDDARRVVLYTLLVMYEWHRSVTPES